jgi:hypothetical protein
MCTTDAPRCGNAGPSSVCGSGPDGRPSTPPPPLLPNVTAASGARAMPAKRSSSDCRAANRRVIPRVPYSGQLYGHPESDGAWDLQVPICQQPEDWGRVSKLGARHSDVHLDNLRMLLLVCSFFACHSGCRCCGVRVSRRLRCIGSLLQDRCRRRLRQHSDCRVRRHWRLRCGPDRMQDTLSAFIEHCIRPLDETWTCYDSKAVAMLHIAAADSMKSMPTTGPTRRRHWHINLSVCLIAQASHTRRCRCGRRRRRRHAGSVGPCAPGGMPAPAGAPPTPATAHSSCPAGRCLSRIGGRHVSGCHAGHSLKFKAPHTNQHGDALIWWGDCNCSGARNYEFRV